LRSAIPQAFVQTQVQSVLTEQSTHRIVLFFYPTALGFQEFLV
jgi:hypothetical protein